jgi:hypothetical protein
MMMKSKESRKNCGLSTKEPGQKRKRGTKKQKLYPVQDEDVFLIPDDFPEGLQYIHNNHIYNAISYNSVTCFHFLL